MTAGMAALFGVCLVALEAVLIFLSRFPWLERLQERLGFADDPEWM